MKPSLIISFAGALLLLAACTEEKPPVTVLQFMDNPHLLEATMVRCARNRSETKYEADCVNAREAVNRLEAANEQQRRKQLEAESASKRLALRRAQEAAVEARRSHLEAQRLNEEAEYLELFEEVSAGSEAGQVIVPATGSAAAPSTGEVARPTTGEIQSQSGTDLNSIPEDDRRRQDPPD